jgi:hypothetical protein
VTYYVMRTGTFPFPSPPNPLPKNYSRPAPDLSGVTEAEQPALLRALAPVPQDRFPSCREMMMALLRAHGLKAIRSEEDTWKIVREGTSEPLQPNKAKSVLSSSQSHLKPSH